MTWVQFRTSLKWNCNIAGKTALSHMAYVSVHHNPTAHTEGPRAALDLAPIDSNTSFLIFKAIVGNINR